MQEHQNDLQALQEAKKEAQAADEESTGLAAQVHQMQMEVSAKQARPLPVIALRTRPLHVALLSGEPPGHPSNLTLP